MKKNYKALPIMLAVFTVSFFYPTGFNLTEGLKEKVCLANSFIMDQAINDSQGALKRYINISSPWSGAYLYENLHVVGGAEVTESFTMYNFGPDAWMRSNTRADDFFNDNAEENPGPVLESNPGSAVESNPAPRGKNSNHAFAVTDIVEAPATMSIPTWPDLF